MNRRTVIKTSIFPASKDEVFRRLKKLKTLQYIAAPFATFTPVSKGHGMVWEENRTSSFYFRLFGFIPLGRHTIKVITFTRDGDIYTHEKNPHVPVWNHRIVLKPIDDNNTLYTDIVEIGAGWKTLFVYLWARAFYSHRQRKWRKLLTVPY